MVKKRVQKKKLVRRKLPTKAAVAPRLKIKLGPKPTGLEVPVGCFGNVCDSKFGRLHLDLDDQIFFSAHDADVTITWYQHDGTPLDPPTNPIVIQNGSNTNTFTVVAEGTFRYTVSCKNGKCQLQLHADPEMIVP